MKLYGYTCTYNEELMIPYAMPYVERLGYDKFIVYDNMSTDRTVELLKKYPFVEVRTYDTNGRFDDHAKFKIQLEAFGECNRIAKVGTSEEESVWMTFTDFDEVLYCNNEYDILRFALGQYADLGYNYFNDKMIELLPPKNMENISLRGILGENQVVHSIDGIRGKFWNYTGCKPTLIYVNDISYYEPSCGNHIAHITTFENKPLKNINEQGGKLLSCFHLKWIDKNSVLERSKKYVERGNDSYNKFDESKKIDDIYCNVLYASSFPIEMYFYDNFKGNYNSVFQITKHLDK